jgi:hypothetical protein
MREGKKDYSEATYKIWKIKIKAQLGKTTENRKTAPHDMLQVHPSTSEFQQATL